ncbi:MAG: T9SS type A sorting domain-containing protein, partial [Ignavibacteriaceae bacterium]|nr:T9SS type A sorting domain-containing protein [Ignavibacteriaceae bacterium]
VNSQWSMVNLKVYDVLGNEVAALVNKEQAPGSYEVTFDGTSLSSGVYFYKLQAGSFSDVKKLLLMK